MKIVPMLILALSSASACSDRPDNATNSAASDVAFTADSGTDTRNDVIFDGGPGDLEVADSANRSDASVSTDAGGDSGNSDMGASDAAGNTDTGVADPDIGAPDVGGDTGPPPYDTTGWDMKRRTLSDSASVGTPDSYFFDVDAGSPLSASITGGGSGVWSVNVFGGFSNHLYCTGTPSCQVMLRPEDVTVIVTAITTDIGGYTLAVDYAGAGLR